ncbi:copper chaperone PCu(A)C [Cryptosporangium sp. NPDC048952]|uniref:copper chaperone PCu(A)C n=1 Tax=Cryptosporangium sp. NPDC048952 TaxID=3363961 RepID=UPI00371BE3AF
MSSRIRLAHFLPAIALTLGLLAAGCSTDASSTTAAAEAPAAPAASAATETTISITDPWFKAADKGMTAAFGTLVNNTDKPLTIVSATSDVSTMELHEMTMKDGKMVMQPKEGGFVLPAKGKHELSPGGDHLMFMELKSPVQAGDEVTFTLKLADGSTVPFTAVAKPYSGAEESYAPDGGMTMSSGSASK